MDVILGTAGHIDHGKTTLVQALTGINCDRLAEEKRRGITIELGFAWLDLPDGRRLGIVDVPGHERFVKNMVAGAAGVDCVLLVIAADEGVMPQTREHLEICSLLGVRSGLVVLTKADLVDREWLEMVREDVQKALAGSFLADAPVLPVSAITGEGLAALRDEIIKLTAIAKPAARSDIFRLPVDRVFSMKGFGTVATGTIISGSCAQGEKLCIVPAGKTGRARNLQVHSTQVESAHAGQRCAVNLQGLEVDDIQRGDIVARPDTLFPSQNWFIRLHCLASSPLPIRQRMQAHFHHGAKECLATIRLRDRDALEPGQSCIAEVKFDRPMSAIYGDRCVIRAHSPLRAIGGGIVISPLPPALQKRKKDYARKCEVLQELGRTDEKGMLAPKRPKELVLLALALCPAPGVDMNRLRVMTGLAKEDLARALGMLVENGEVFCWDNVNWIGKDAMEECLALCHTRARDLHRREPMKIFFAPNALVSSWGEKFPEKFTQEVINLAVKRGLLRQEGAGLKLAEHKVSFDAAAAEMLEILRAKINEGAIAPPFIREIAEEQGWEVKKMQPLLNYLCECGEMLKIQEGVYYNRNEFSKIVNKIMAWFDNHDRLEIAAIKEIFGISRKYAIPILEYLDAMRITCRVGNSRRLRKN